MARNIPTHVKTALLAYYELRCQKCGAFHRDVDLVFGHIVPHKDGGSASLHNLLPICVRCNGLNGVRHEPPEWYEYNHKHYYTKVGNKEQLNAVHGLIVKQTEQMTKLLEMLKAPPRWFRRKQDEAIPERTELGEPLRLTEPRQYVPNPPRPGWVDPMSIPFFWQRRGRG
jgi:HNH endonuclease